MGISLVAILLLTNSSYTRPQFVFHYPNIPKRHGEFDELARKFDDSDEEFGDLIENDVMTWPNEIDNSSFKSHSFKLNSHKSGLHDTIEDLKSAGDSNGKDIEPKDSFNKLFGFEKIILANILCPKTNSSKFQLSIDNLTLVGQPVFLERQNTCMDTKQREELDNPTNFDEDEEQVDNIYKHIITKLTAALEYEQRRSNYVRKEADLILSLRENMGKTSMDELMELILEKSTLANTIRQVYDSISTDSIAHVLVNDYIDLSLQIPPLSPTMFFTPKNDVAGYEYAHYPVIAPYHTLLLLEDPEEILKNIPLDANPTLVQLVQILTPTQRLADLCSVLDCSLAQIFRIAAHLIYWRKAKIIDVISVRNTYVVSPTADMNSLQTHIEYFNQHFPEALDLVTILASLSTPRPYFISTDVFKDHRTMYLEAMTYLLRKDLVIQLHAYIFFMIPQHIKMGEEHPSNVDTNNGVMDTSLISPYDKASDVERLWLNKFVESRSKDQTNEFKVMFKRTPPPLPPLPKTSLTPKQNAISEEYPVLLTKSKEELEDLLNNDIVFESFLETVEPLRGMNALQNEVLLNNKVHAEKTLSQEQELIQLQQKVEAKEKELKELYSTLQEKNKVQHETLQRFSSSVLLAKLKSEVHQSDELSEQMASSFLMGDLECDQFLKHFKEIRKVYHMRNAKVERVSKKPEILGLDQLVYVFVDNSNVLIEGKYAVAELKNLSTFDKKRDSLCFNQFRIDHGHLLATIQDDRKLGDDPVIVGLRPPPDDSLWRHVREQGNSVMIFDRNFENREKKDNITLGHAIDEIIFTKNPSTLAIISGGSDFEPIVETAIKRNWIVETWFWNMDNYYKSFAYGFGSDITRSNRILEVTGHTFHNWGILYLISFRKEYTNPINQLPPSLIQESWLQGTKY
ncbi:2294_t:CDS:10 [Diversispora eburnea]|uniref:Nitrogen permease regulator 3 n=1 Tax=Diversispora eburnea TaxID=1213867 RepID=A0A9N8ZM56_9GLOM|nr:2294_t:CDS:10 [Diversispora eburnea]